MYFGKILAAVLLFHAILAAESLLSQNNGSTRVRTDEQSLRVVVDGGYGTIHIRPAAGDNVYEFSEKMNDDETTRASVSYVVKDQQARLTISLNEHEDEDRTIMESLGCIVKGKRTSEWNLGLSDRIPIDLSVELGAGEAVLDLSGLRITRMKLETGASSMRVVVTKKNPVTMRIASISAGVGSIKTEGLGNLNFERMKFEGGLGSYQLDLSGDIRHEASVSAELGMGSLVIVLPKGIGVRMHSGDSFLSSTNYRRFIRLDDDRYETPSYSTAGKKISMKIDSGIGSVSVKWKE